MPLKNCSPRKRALSSREPVRATYMMLCISSTIYKSRSIQLWYAPHSRRNVVRNSSNRQQIVGTSANLPSTPLAVAGGPAGVPSRIHGGTLEQLRFAGANRLLVGFAYSAKGRIVEPYSLRFAETTGNLNFYGWELAGQQIKCFTVSKMSAVRILEQTFAPRYHVELGTPRAISHGPWRW